MHAYLLPILAVVIGVVIAFITKHKQVLHTRLLLSFSGAFLLAVTLFNLLPELYLHLSPKIIGLLIMMGILIQIILEFFSRGAEHGHVHFQKTKHFPWLLFVSLCIHSFLEGFPMHEHNSIVYGVVVHKIPIATLLAVFLFESAFKKSQIFIFLLVFALTTPLGTFVSNQNWLAPNHLNYMNAIVVGIFLHISTTIIFETGEGHKFNISKLLAIILGVSIAYFL